MANVTSEFLIDSGLHQDILHHGHRPDLLTCFDKNRLVDGTHH